MADDAALATDGLGPCDVAPVVVDLLVGDATKAGKALGWEPNITFTALIEMMVEADLELLKSGGKVR